MEIDYLQGLNDPQRSAVENYAGPSLIIAGAGSGKTRVLTMRIAHMLRQGISPRNIMALTFTNKAAREMRDRVTKILPYDAVRGLWMGTFHSLFSRILRAEAGLLGFPEAFTIYDTADSRNVVKAIVRQLELPDEQYKPNEVYARISLAKNNLVLPEAYAANATLTEEDARAKRPRLAEIYALYMRQCRQNGAMDFDDLLLYMNILLRDHPEIAQKYGEQFQYILVDEYQDTNYSQYLIVKKLADIRRNICVVGDDSQSIYSFRGARIENILRFQQDYPEAKIFKLEQNYRSTRTIVEAANSVIEKNSRKLPKHLFSENEQGDPIRVICTLSDKEEAQRVAADIHTTLYGRQASPDDFAVLYRTNAQSRVIEEHLRGNNIPYRIYGGQSFYQRAEIKDAIAYLRLAINPKDDESLKRIINFPARGIGETSIGKIVAAGQAEGVSMWEVLLRHTPEELGIRGGAVKSLGAFVRNFTELFRRSGEMDAYELAMEVMSRSGLIAHYKDSPSIEDESRLQNVEELINSVKVFVDEQLSGEGAAEGGESVAPQADLPQEGVVHGPVTLDQWLQNIALLTDMDNSREDDTPRVTLLTVHASKGLEFKYTYIVGLEENLFPSQHGGSASAEDIEEERRLFYVALTRAEKRATLSFALSRFKWGSVVPSQASRFIKEIDPKYLDMPPLPDTDSRGDGNAALRNRWNTAGTAARTGDPRPAFQRYQRKTATPPAPPVQAPAGFKRTDTRPASVPQGKPLDSAGELTVGARVAHDRFGSGTVTAFEQTATDTKVTVRFEAAGTKTLLLKFARLRLI
ncbi:ATP-dependent helicase [Rikenella microfusus]|uniref:DNA 3'-5' helicase n=1 Tax=Rikenella microfusus TaxID=28139 RepID=A0A379MP70_9BACT|nr:UvrD-helicase domain-containing protein [Rikenella microfusus]SUE33451.1 ATP-dependent DNA helicase pcrA [Rikenella microfusus]